MKEIGELGVEKNEYFLKRLLTEFLSIKRAFLIRITPKILVER